MLTITTGPLTSEEKKPLPRKSRYKQFEEFIIAYISITLVLFLPLLLFERYFSPHEELLIAIPLLVAPVFILRWIKKNSEKTR